MPYGFYISYYTATKIKMQEVMKSFS